MPSRKWEISRAGALGRDAQIYPGVALADFTCIFKLRSHGAILHPEHPLAPSSSTIKRAAPSFGLGVVLPQRAHPVLAPLPALWTSAQTSPSPPTPTRTPWHLSSRTPSSSVTPKPREQAQHQHQNAAGAPPALPYRSGGSSHRASSIFGSRARAGLVLLLLTLWGARDVLQGSGNLPTSFAA